MKAWIPANWLCGCSIISLSCNPKDHKDRPLPLARPHRGTSPESRERFLKDVLIFSSRRYGGIDDLGMSAPRLLWLRPSHCCCWAGGARASVSCDRRWPFVAALTHSRRFDATSARRPHQSSRSLYQHRVTPPPHQRFTPTPKLNSSSQHRSAVPGTTRHCHSSTKLPAMAETQWTGLKVRQTFLEFFEKRGHKIGMRCLPPRPSGSWGA